MFLRISTWNFLTLWFSTSQKAKRSLGRYSFHFHQSAPLLAEIRISGNRLLFIHQFPCHHTISGCQWQNKTANPEIASISVLGTNSKTIKCALTEFTQKLLRFLFFSNHLDKIPANQLLSRIPAKICPPSIQITYPRIFIQNHPCIT
jgi:hypothetical protein